MPFYRHLKRNMDSMYALQNLYRLYTDPSRVGDRNRVEYRASKFPVIGDYLTARDNERYINDYLANRGLTWDDVKYPALLKGSGSASRMLTADVKAVERLYRY